MIEMGTYAELLTTSASFAQLLEDINQHEEEQQPVPFSTQQSRIGSICSEKEDVELLPTSIETKKEGTVKWHVYVAYIRAGVGILLGILLIVIVFSAQQVIDVYSNWWLAGWSDDESRRHHIVINCTNIRDVKTEKIHAMNTEEWNAHRNRRFYMFCGEFEEHD
jgi:hypothetical protein